MHLTFDQTERKENIAMKIPSPSDKDFWYTSPAELPIYKSWRYKVGRAVDLWAVPCTPTPEIWVSAFFHDIPHLLWSLTKPDSMDLTFDRFGLKHKRKPKKRFNIIDDMIGSSSVPGGKVGVALFRGAQIAQRVGWYLLVADATADFAINWVSTAYRWTGCDQAAAGYGSSIGKTGYRLIHDFEGDPAPIWDPVGDQFPVTASAGYMQVAPGHDSNCGVSISVRSEAGTGYDPGIISSVELVDYDSGAIIGQATPTLMSDGSYLARTYFRDWNAIKPSKKFGVKLTVPQTAWFNFEGSTFSCMADKDQGLISDP